MENGQVYRATTEAHPGPGIGPRSGLAAYFTLSRLTGFRRLKLLELVSPRLGRERRQRAAPCLLLRGGRFHIPGSFPLRPGRGRPPRGSAGAPSSGAPPRGPAPTPARPVFRDHPACLAGAGNASESQASGLPVLCFCVATFGSSPCDYPALSPKVPCLDYKMLLYRLSGSFAFPGAHPTGQLNLLDRVFRYYARRRERCLQRVVSSFNTNWKRIISK